MQEKNVLRTEKQISLYIFAWPTTSMAANINLATQNDSYTDNFLFVKA